MSVPADPTDLRPGRHPMTFLSRIRALLTPARTARPDRLGYEVSEHDWPSSPARVDVATTREALRRLRSADTTGRNPDA